MVLILSLNVSTLGLFFCNILFIGSTDTWRVNTEASNKRLIPDQPDMASMHTENEFIQSLAQHQNIVHKVCNLYMNDVQDRKDLFQEIVLGAWKGFANFRGDAKFSTWLYRVALNIAITFYRKEKKQLAVSAYSDQYNDAFHDSEPAEDEQLAAMHRAIGDLSAIDKGLVMLYLEDYQYSEIGEIMGISANNVAVKMNRIKIKLKENSKKYL